MNNRPYTLRWQADSAVRSLTREYPHFAAMGDRLKALATSLDDLALLLLNKTRPLKKQSFLRAVLARAQALFLGALRLAESNPLSAAVLLRAYVEVLATTVYVRNDPQHMSTVFEKQNRPSIEKRIQSLEREWPERTRLFYRTLTNVAHFNEAHGSLQRVPGKPRDVVIARVFPNEQYVADILLILIQVTEKQVDELQRLLES